MNDRRNRDASRLYSRYVRVSFTRGPFHVTRRRSFGFRLEAQSHGKLSAKNKAYLQRAPDDAPPCAAI